MNELIITLMKKHLLDSMLVSSFKSETCNDQEINPVWLCVDGKMCNGSRPLSIEHTHVIEKIKEFIRNYSENSENSMIIRKKKTFFQLLEQFLFLEKDIVEIMYHAELLTDIVFKQQIYDHLWRNSCYCFHK